ncbi:hypothetical protein ACKD5O_005131, partial [Escherichia coli]
SHPLNSKSQRSADVISHCHPSSPDEDNITQARDRKRATSISENEIPTITHRTFAGVMSLSDIATP